MDFGRDCLVFVRGEEKTDNILELGTIGASVNIQYGQKDLIYSYDTNSATVLSDPEIIDLSQGAVLYYNNIPLSGVSEAYKFSGFYSVYFEDDPRRTYQEASICVEPNIQSEFTPNSYLHPDSVLHQYIKEEYSAPDTFDDEPVVFPFNANINQKTAIKKALANKISIIDSPPCTGETHTALNLILNIAAVRNQTVAVVSCDNAALDRISEKMEAAGYGYLKSRPGREAPEVFSADQEDENDQKREANNQSISALNLRLETFLNLEMKEKKLKKKLSLWKLEQLHFKKANKDKPAKKIKVLPGKKWDMKKKLRLWADMEMLLAEDKLDAFWPTPSYLMKYGIEDFEGLFLSADESIYALQHAYIDEKIKELEKELNEIQKSLEVSKYKRLLEYQKELSGIYIKKILNDRYQESQDEFNSETYIEDVGEYEIFLKNHPVVLCEIDSIKELTRNNYVYDYMIIYKASEVGFLTGIPALTCCRNVVFLGDSKQPTPNLMSSVIEKFTDSVPRTLLNGQYLCDPSVVRYFSEKYYENKLIAFKDSENDEPSRATYHAQAEDFARELKISLESTDDFSRYTKYLWVNEDNDESNAIPVFDLLYKDYNSVLLPLQKTVLKKSKYSTKLYIFSKLVDILKDKNYESLRFRYNVRLSDILIIDEPTPEEEKIIKNSTVDFIIYSVFDKKPELVINVGVIEGQKDILLERNGINVFRIIENSGNEEKRIIQKIEKVFRL